MHGQNVSLKALTRVVNAQITAIRDLYLIQKQRWYDKSVDVPSKMQRPDKSNSEVGHFECSTTLSGDV